MTTRVTAMGETIFRPPTNLKTGQIGRIYSTFHKVPKENLLGKLTQNGVNPPNLPIYGWDLPRLAC